MSFRNRLLTLSLCCAVSASLLMLSGCEDVQARNTAAESSAGVRKLESEIQSLRDDNAKMREQIKAVQEALAKQVTDRMDKLEERLLLVSKDLLDKVAKDADATRQTASTIVNSARGDYDKELNSVKTTLAGDIQKIRDEMKTTMEDLKKFMDNQLRELYPYAYQPRRQGPPEAETK
ncbi:MAG TPA: hypothetical protein VEK08_25995 [Planctomycetota bacterium]|nr:hypothetical protein [Planctomycetota bacterium]